MIPIHAFSSGIPAITRSLFSFFICFLSGFKTFRYFKTIAAFANNAGGYIIFGVANSPRRLEGLKEKNLTQFEELKVEEFTKNLTEYFSPEIKWSHCTFEFKGKSFGVIYTYPLSKKPCICKKVYESQNPKYTLMR